MKYYSLGSSRLVCLRKDSTIDLAISYLQRISVPMRLRTILQILQLTAFLTYNWSSKSKAFRPVYVYWLILDNPSLVDKRSPIKRVASLRILTTLQWLKAEARPTHPCSIMLPTSIEKYFFLLHRWPFRWEWWERWCSGLGLVFLLEGFRLIWGLLYRRQPCRLRYCHTWL